MNVHINTESLILLMKNASGRNRSFPKTVQKEMADKLDPKGVHILHLHFPHEHINGVKVDIHYRTKWLVKLTGRTDPADWWLDVDIKLFNSVINEVDPEILKSFRAQHTRETF